jgi:arylsulfatase
MSGRSRFLFSTFVAAGLTATSCGPSHPPLPTARNVLLIVVDTLRSDHLGAYGFPRETVPHLDALAADGALFRNAYTVAPWTLATLASIHTGLYPRTHGATDPTMTLSREAVTLAEILHEEGFATLGIVSNELVKKHYLMDQGFDIYDESTARGHRYISSEAVTQRTASFLRRLDREKRFFAYVHYFDPHFVYRRHAQYGFAPATAGRLEGGERISLLREIMDTMTDEELEFVVDSYDEEVRFTDTAIGDLLRTLDELGLTEETLVILTADHGEEFMERDWIGHTRTLYDELMRVPLLVALPGIPPGRLVDAPVSVVGIAATVLELLGLDPSRHGFQVGSFAPLLVGDEAAAPEDVYLSCDFEPLFPNNDVKRTFMKGVLRGSHKLVLDERDGTYELYDLVADPAERRDLTAVRTDLFDELGDRLDDLIEEESATPLASEKVELEERQIETLRSLGYAGQ